MYTEYATEELKQMLDEAEYRMGDCAFPAHHGDLTAQAEFDEQVAILNSISAELQLRKYQF